MKGGTIKQILSTMNAGELSGFLAQLKTLPKGKVLCRICQILMGHDDILESKLSRVAKISSKNKSAYLIELGGLLTSYLASFGSRRDGLGSFETARRLIFIGAEDVAFEILKNAFSIAEKSEDFPFIIELNSLIEVAYSKPSFSYMSRSTAESRLASQIEIGKLFEDLKKLRNLHSGEKREKTILGIRNKALAIYQSEGRLGKMSVFRFLKLQVLAEFMLGNIEASVRSQEAALAFVESEASVFIDNEYFIAKEIKYLSYLYWRIKAFAEFQEVSNRLYQMSFSSKRAEFEKVHQQFPFLIGVAIETGNLLSGVEACNRLIGYVNKGAFAGKEGLLAESLYCASYFHFSSQNAVQVSRTLASIAKIPKAAFPNKFFVLCRVIEICFCIEEKDYEDSLRLIKNLRKSKKTECFPFFNNCINFLKLALKTSEIDGSITGWEKLQLIFSSGDSPLESLEFNKYFDFGVWIQSKIETRPMIEIFKQRTDPKAIFEYYI